MMILLILYFEMYQYRDICRADGPRALSHCVEKLIHQFISTCVPEYCCLRMDKQLNECAYFKKDLLVCRKNRRVKTK